MPRIVFRWLSSSACVCRTSLQMSASTPSTCVRTSTGAKGSERTSSHAERDTQSMQTAVYVEPLPTTPAEARKTSATPEGALRRLLFGAPFAERVDGVDPSLGQLDCLLGDIIELLRAEHGAESRAFRQAEREITDAARAQSDVGRCAAAKRGLLLFALWRDPEIARRFEASDAQLLAHLREHVLPVVGPIYLQNLGQRPDSFVFLCAVLTALWGGVPLAIPEPTSGAGAEEVDTPA
jgi:hypothetical protein